ncbi:TPA: hypothetical protein IX049_001833 [Enterococcus faecium]|uniref:hypothetical protein n=1 Tax=Enterococcus faecium TaxID=1352 RepID=UPI000E1B7223|nr:hypothetical protein [Enterococcus faecium]HAQ5689026.1 hypothetical protein [Enterococcus faecium]
MSIISFILSTFLTGIKIKGMRPQLEVELNASYFAADMIYTKVIISNYSTEPAMLVNLELSSANLNRRWSATPFMKLIAKGGSVDDNRIYSEAVPLNIPPKSAISCYLAFEVGKINFNKLLNHQTKMIFTLNRTQIHKIVDIKNTNFPIEKLVKELN